MEMGARTSEAREDGHPWTALPKEAAKKCVVITDSNRRGASANSIKNHISREEREGLKIEVVVAYMVEEAYHRIRRGEIEVEGKIVVVDNVTNDVRKVCDPWEVGRRMTKVLDALEGAAAVVAVQVKPIRHLDITPYNETLHHLCTTRKGVFGCHTQIRMDDLGRDGYHVSPQCADIIDRTYVRALLGAPVPSPTPPGDFFHPEQMREYTEAFRNKCLVNGAID